VIDTSALRSHDPLGHNAFADRPELIGLLGRRLMSCPPLQKARDLLRRRTRKMGMSVAPGQRRTRAVAADAVRRRIAI